MNNNPQNKYFNRFQKQKTTIHVTLTRILTKGLPINNIKEDQFSIQLKILMLVKKNKILI